MKKATKEDQCSYLSLIKKMERLDRDMREVKEALLSLKGKILNHEELEQLQFSDDTDIQGPENDNK